MTGWIDGCVLFLRAVSSMRNMLFEAVLFRECADVFSTAGDTFIGLSGGSGGSD